MFRLIRKLFRKAFPCRRCDNTGVWETGNNDLPCDCVAGATALFSVCTANGVELMTGAESQRHHAESRRRREADTEDDVDLGNCACCGKPACIRDKYGNNACLRCAVVRLDTNEISCTPENPHCPRRER